MKAQHTLLAICCTNLMLLVACGSGGGGSGGMVRQDPPPVPPLVPPPPPPAAPPVVCPSPISADCLVTGPANTGQRMDGGRQSDYALTLRHDKGWLSLAAGTYRFGGGSVVELGSLSVDRDSTLQSNVMVQAPARFNIGGTVIGNLTNYGWTELLGTVIGNIANSGRTELWGMVTGDLENHGTLAAGATIWGDPIKNTIQGNFRQSADGTLSTTIPYGTFFGLLQVTGRADLDGTLQLNAYSDHWGPYPLPATPLSAHVLHADGGVFGRFAQWTAPGLFVEGSVRYGSNDVWFDLTRLSVQAAMAANAVADPLTLASAANIDAALTQADGFALTRAAPLQAAQRRFLASAASLLYSRDLARATRSLDSLSGHAHALAQDVLREQATTSAAQLDTHLDRVPRGAQAPWSSPLAHAGHAGGSYSIEGRSGGYEQWLGPQWLVGGSVTSGQSRMQFERMGGQARGESPMASVYAHYRGDRWHATGLVGAGRSRLQLDRPIDLGAAGTHLAHSRREIDLAFVHGELARRIALGNGRLTPFAALDYSALRSNGFAEQGDTGFELVARPGRTTQWSTAVGARYAHDWQLGERGWLRLNLDGRYQRRLAAGGDVQQAAFAGVPDAVFDLTAWPQAEGVAAVNLGLAGGFGDRWTWSADYARRFGIDTGKGGWFVGLRRDF